MKQKTNALLTLLIIYSRFVYVLMNAVLNRNDLIENMKHISTKNMLWGLISVIFYQLKHS